MCFVKVGELEEISLVVGFITDGKRVLLINKNRPENQKGLFNGVGGAVQENETPLEAMVREAKEETGLEIKEWIEIDVFPYPNGITLYLYQATISCKEIEQFQSPTDEKVSLFDKDELPENLVHDVAYIVKRRLNFLFPSMELTINREIIDLKEKMAFIKQKQKANKVFANEPFVLVEYKNQKLFFDITKLSGKKYFFFIPYNKYLINNDWKHKALCMNQKLESILQHIKVFDADFKEFSEKEAKAFLEERFGLK